MIANHAREAEKAANPYLRSFTWRFTYPATSVGPPTCLMSAALSYILSSNTAALNRRTGGVTHQHEYRASGSTKVLSGYECSTQRPVFESAAPQLYDNPETKIKINSSAMWNKRSDGFFLLHDEHGSRFFCWSFVVTGGVFAQ